MIETFILSCHIVRRNWVVYRKNFIANISPSIADPMFLILSLGMGLGPFIQEINGMTYSKFLAPGMMAGTALFTSFFESSYGFYVRMTYENIFKTMLTTHIGVAEVVIGEFIWVGLKGAIMSLGVGLVLTAMGLVINPWSLMLIPLFGALIAIPCGALGLLASSYVKNIDQFQMIYSFVIAPIYFLSGGFFPIESRPHFAEIMQFSPFFHGVHLMQEAVWGRLTLTDFTLHLLVMLSFSLGLGYFAYLRILKKLRS